MQNAILSANSVPVDAGNRLRVSFWNSNPDNSYTVIIRFQILLPDGTISDNADERTIPAFQQDLPFLFPLTDGQLIFASVFCTATGLQEGELYCTIGVQYGSVSAFAQLLSLIGGYLASGNPLAFPLGNNVPKNTDRPANITQPFSTPTTGSEILAEFSPLFFTRLINFTFQFHADANAANRTIVLNIDDLNGKVLTVTHATPITATEDITFYLWTGTIPATIPANVRFIQLPEMPFAQGVTITSVTENIQAGDEFDNIIGRSKKYVA